LLLAQNRQLFEKSGVPVPKLYLLPDNFRYEEMVIELAVFYSQDFDRVAGTKTEYDYYLMKLKQAKDSLVEDYILKRLKNRSDRGI